MIVDGQVVEWLKTPHSKYSLHLQANPSKFRIALFMNQLATGSVTGSRI